MTRVNQDIAVCTGGKDKTVEGASPGCCNFDTNVVTCQGYAVVPRHCTLVAARRGEILRQDFSGSRLNKHIAVLGPPSGSTDVCLAESVNELVGRPARIGGIVTRIRTGLQHAEWECGSRKRIASAVGPQKRIYEVGMLRVRVL